MIGALLRFITAPFKWTGNILRKSSTQTGKTVQQSGVSEIARQASDNDNLDQVVREADGQIGNSFLFTELSRPLLAERSAADLSLDEAREISHQAERFYTHNFSLFAQSNLFYEQVEQGYLNEALGVSHNSMDSKFVVTMDRFRRVLNANTMKLHVIYTPMLLLAGLLLGVLTIMIGGAEKVPMFIQKFAGNGPVVSFLVDGFWLFVIASGQLVLIGLLYSWPYRVTQRNNLFGLDNYITSKFSRINQQFQVAKRQALNVERNMRMSQAAELKEQAGIWTITYQWFAFRLLLCEMTVRNKIYQVRRNTTLYGVAGAIVCLLVGAGTIGLVAALHLTQLGFWDLASRLGAMTLIFVSVSFLMITRKATSEVLRTLQTREWNRFHLIDLHHTIAEHVGEDKLQIVTFRDRNRME